MIKNEKIREHQFTITKLNNQNQQNTRINRCLERDLTETKKIIAQNEIQHKNELEQMQLKNEKSTNKNKKLQKSVKKMRTLKTTTKIIIKAIYYHYKIHNAYINYFLIHK